MNEWMLLVYSVLIKCYCLIILVLSFIVHFHYKLDPSATPPSIFWLAGVNPGWRAGAPLEIRLAAAPWFSRGGTAPNSEHKKKIVLSVGSPRTMTIFFLCSEFKVVETVELLEWTSLQNVGVPIIVVPICTNFAIFVLPAEVLTTDLDSLTVISYSCSLVTILPYLTSCSIGNYVIDRDWVQSGIYVHPRPFLLPLWS